MENENQWVEHDCKFFPNVGVNDRIEIMKFNGEREIDCAGSFWWHNNKNSKYSIDKWRLLP